MRLAAIDIIGALGEEWSVTPAVFAIAREADFAPAVGVGPRAGRGSGGGDEHRAAADGTDLPMNVGVVALAGAVARGLPARYKLGIAVGALTGLLGHVRLLDGRTMPPGGASRRGGLLLLILLEMALLCIQVLLF